MALRSLVADSCYASGLALLVVALAPVRAGAVCDDFLFTSSISCSTHPHCVHVNALASGGGPSYSDFVWSHDAEPLDDMLSFQSSDGASSGSGSCIVSSEIGTLRASSAGDAMGTRALGMTGSGSCYAMFRITDLVFSGPASEVEATLRLELGGTFAAAASGDSDTNAQANAVLTINGRICDASGSTVHSFTGDRDRLVADLGDDPPETTERKQSGLLSGALSGLLEVGPFTAPVGEPLQLELEMNTSAIALVTRNGGDDPSGSASALVDYGDTLGFPSQAPAFELPEGFGVASAQAGIQIPEPTSAWGAATALAALVVLRRR